MSTRLHNITLKKREPEKFKSHLWAWLYHNLLAVFRNTDVKEKVESSTKADHVWLSKTQSTISISLLAGKMVKLKGFNHCQYVSQLLPSLTFLEKLWANFLF
jgi:hypothetical protein